MSDKSAGELASGRYAYQGLDRVFHEKARLGILTSLMANPEGLLFSDLKSLCDLTDGNLSRHLQILNEAGLVEIDKFNSGRRPLTLYRLSATGRERFLAYLAVLESIVRDAAVTVTDGDATVRGRAYFGSKWASV